MPNYVFREYKSILNKLKFIDSWFWCRYTLNPYQGCEHDCPYCDARSDRYHLHSDFEDTIFVKKDAGRKLDLRISRARTLLPDVVAMAGVCDAYQPAEERFENTRSCLLALAKHGWPVSLATKACLVTRDLDVFREIARKSWAAISFTITTTDRKVADFLEPRAAPPEERFQAISRIKEKAPEVNCGVLFMPIIPGLEDSEENLEAVVSRAKEAGADYILFSPGLTMRDRQALYFLKHLREGCPGFLSLYEDIYQFSYDPEEYTGNYTPKKSYMKCISKMVLRLLEEYEIPARVHRFIPEDFRKQNYQIAEKLLNIAHHDQILGKKFSNTQWAALNLQNLTEPVADVARRGELRNIRNMDEDLEKFVLEELGSLNDDGQTRLF